MDGWDVFGGDDVAPVVPPSLPAKRARSDETLSAALAPFLDADGAPITVPRLPPLHQPTEAEKAQALQVWPDHPPLRLGPIAFAELVDECGRGFVASRDIAVGEVLMVEAPLVRWPGAERTPLVLLRAVLASDACHAVVAAMRRLHPVDLQPLASLADLEAEYQPTIDALLPLWRAAGLPRDAVPGAAAAASDERASLLQLCLAVRWNAFDSGLFLHQAIFNHAPSRHANCDKAAIAAPAASAGGGGAVSVVRATRPIAAGAQCLISYLQPPELSAAASVARLRHFDFDAGVRPRDDVWDRAPDDARDGCVGADARTRALEDEAQRRVAAALRERALRKAVARSRAALGALGDALGEGHLSVASARRALCEGLRRRVQAGEAAAAADDEGAAALLLLLEAALELWTTQRALLGPLHPECAQTLHDVGGALGALLARGARHLFAAHPAVWGTPAAAARGEQRAMELHAQIAALYDTGALLPMTGGGGA